MDCLLSNSSTKTVNVGKEYLSYSQKGKGELIVLLPPPILDHRIYCDLQQKLAANYRSVAIDLPSSKNVNEVLYSLQKSIQIGTTQKFHLVASSATGWIAQFLTKEMTKQIKSLILINSFYSNSDYGTTYKLALKSTKLLPNSKFKKQVLERSKFLRKGIPHNSITEKYFKERVDNLGKSGIRQQMSWFIENRTDPEPINIPLLLISASKDPIISNDQYNKILSSHRKTSHEQIITDSHFLFLSHTSIILDNISKFVSSLA